MKFARVLLLLSAVVFVIVGIGFLIVPGEWAGITEISLPTAMARTDLRATYGGLDLAVGIFLWICARRDQWIRPGLVALALTAAGFGGGRLVGIVAEGSAAPLMLIFLAIEAVTVVVALATLRRLAATR
jgi:uncharacterized membrane protein